MAQALDSRNRDTGGVQVQDIVARFIESWQKAEPWIESINLAAFLPPRGSAVRTAVLLQLVVVDLDMRYGRKQTPTLEDYLEKFPELGTPATVAVELIHEEYSLRQRHGQTPSILDYERRFPKQYAQLRKCIQEDATPTVTVSMEKSEPDVHIPPPTPVASTVGGLVEQFLNEKGYRLFEKLGAGASGEVRRAEAPGGVGVALKIIRRFAGDQTVGDREQEALQLIKGLRHPYLLQTQAFWSLEEYLLIVMDLADGTLGKTPGLSRDELLRIFSEAAEAIDYLHDQNIQHRDIKPGNILLLKGHAKVADFGLARFHKANDQTTKAGAGTPAYMAPEVFSGSVSQHSDQFSLALSYAELRRGRKVYPDRGGNFVAYVNDRLSGALDLKGLDAAEEQVVRKALHNHPNDRYPTCVAFVTALREALYPESVAAALPHSRSKAVERNRTPSGQAEVLEQQSNHPESRAERPSGETLHPVRAPEADPPRKKRKTVKMEPGAKTVSALAPVPLTKSPAAIRPVRSGRRWLMIAALLLTLVVSFIPFIPALRLFFFPARVAREVDWLPAGAEKANDATIIPVLGGKNYYNRIVVVKHGLRVPFRLIPREKETDPPTFYLMENKVSNAQYQAAVRDPEFDALLRPFAVDHPEIVRNEWQKGGKADALDVGIADLRLPVLRVTVTEAHCFAHWLGGRLPSAPEWDKASGQLLNGRTAPFRDPDLAWEAGQIAVNRRKEGPMPVGTATRDESPYGCFDLSGNGLEWTRTTDKGGPPVPVDKPSDEVRVVIRGREYWAAQPLRFGDKNFFRTHLYTDALPSTGFRVALEVAAP